MGEFVELSLASPNIVVSAGLANGGPRWRSWTAPVRLAGTQNPRTLSVPGDPLAANFSRPTPILCVDGVRLAISIPCSLRPASRSGPHTEIGTKVSINRDERRCSEPTQPTPNPVEGHFSTAAGACLLPLSFSDESVSAQHKMVKRSSIVNHQPVPFDQRKRTSWQDGVPM